MHDLWTSTKCKISPPWGRVEWVWKEWAALFVWTLCQADPLEWLARIPMLRAGPRRHRMWLTRRAALPHWKRPRGVRCEAHPQVHDLREAERGEDKEVALWGRGTALATGSGQRKHRLSRWLAESEEEAAKPEKLSFGEAVEQQKWRSPWTIEKLLNNRHVYQVFFKCWTTEIVEKLLNNFSGVFQVLNNDFSGVFQVLNNRNVGETVEQ